MMPGSDDGVVTEDKKILKRIVKFSDLEVNDIMRPDLMLLLLKLNRISRNLLK